MAFSPGISPGNFVGILQNEMGRTQEFANLWGGVAAQATPTLGREGPWSLGFGWVIHILLEV